MIINGFGICYLFVLVFLLSQPSNRDLDYPLWDVLYLRWEKHKEKRGLKQLSQCYKLINCIIETPKHFSNMIMLANVKKIIGVVDRQAPAN